MKLSLPTRVLHWLVAVGIFFLLATGMTMTSAEIWALYPLHKSIGVVLFLIIILRVVFRLKNGMPMAINRQSAWLHKLAKMTHWGLLSLTLILPISGMVVSWSSGHGFGVFAIKLVAINTAADNPTEVIAHSQAIYDAAALTHEFAGYLLITLLMLHVAGALKHHFIDKDNILKRMMLFTAEK